LALNYSYTNDAGFAKFGTVNIAYVATVPQYLYVANASGTTVSSCEINLDGTLQPCVAKSGFFAPQGIAIAGGEVYVANSGNNSLSECALGTGGALGTCTTTGSAPSAPAVVVVNAADTSAYINQSTGLSVCPITGGAVGVCSLASASVSPLVGIALSADGTQAYSVNTGTPSVIDVCTVANTGLFTTCAATGSNAPQPSAVLGIANGNVYVASTTGALYVCPVNVGGVLGACAQTAVGTNPNALVFNGNTAYLSNGSAILICPVNVDGSFGTCAPSSDPTFDGTAGLAIH
jgi:hypothetical protein